MRLRLVCISLLVNVSCGGPSMSSDDAGADATVSDAGTDAATVDGGPVELLPRCEATEDTGEGVLTHVASTLVATIAPEVGRAAAAGPLNPATENGEMMYRGLRYDR